MRQHFKKTLPVFSERGRELQVYNEETFYKSDFNKRDNNGGSCRKGHVLFYLRTKSIMPFKLEDVIVTSAENR